MKEHTREITEEMLDDLQEILDGTKDECRIETDDGHIIIFYSKVIDCRNCGDSVHMDDAYREEFCDSQCYEITYEREARERHEDAQYEAHRDKMRGL